MDGHVRRARDLLARNDLDALVILKAENRRYLTGFTGSSGTVILTPSATTLVVDFRYAEQARAEAPGCQVVPGGAQPFDAVVAALQPMRRIGFEREVMTVGTHERLRERLPARDLVGLGGVDLIRAVKDPSELAAIARAAEIADHALREVLDLVRAGAVERDVALALEIAMRRLGADDRAFETIVASGPRSALPHGRAADRRLERGDLVTIDWGAQVGGYCSDCTRTYALADPPAQAAEVYTVVLEAQRAALDAVRPGALGREVDAVARAIIAEAGYGGQFGHGAGHGVGLEVHEEPKLNTQGEVALEAGMVITIEPGVYLPPVGGVRIEDLVVVEPGGCRVLTQVPKGWTVL